MPTFREPIRLPVGPADVEAERFAWQYVFLKTRTPTTFEPGPDGAMHFDFVVPLRPNAKPLPRCLTDDPVKFFLFPVGEG